MSRLAFDHLSAKFPATYDGPIPAAAASASPSAGLAPHPPVDIEAVKEVFQAQAFATQREVAACLAAVHAECARVTAMALFNTNLAKSVRLDEFQLSQTQAADYVQGYLRNTWGTACRSAVVSGLQSVGKGWFNLSENNQEVYDISKLKKFMRMVKYIMEDALHTLVKV